MSGQRKALIVANDEYDREELRNLLAPSADAEALGQVLGDRQIGDFTVQVVRNEPAHVISAHIEELFSESRSDDVLLLHFSGHGLKSESGELFFAASNTRPDRLRATAVSADFVQRCMRDSRSRSVVLLLDCCYGGAFAQGVMVRAAGDVNVLDSFPQERTGGGRGRAVITASSAMEFAVEGNQVADDGRRRPSVFTSALVEGLATGEADRDEDGWVSLNELYDYVFDKVREQNPHQTPSRLVELEGELYVARSRRRRIRPAPLPPDLQAAVTDPSMFARLGAVGELRSRLASDNLPVAAGAYEALADLARIDIRYVAEPAGAALSLAALHPEETELHFGRIEQGSAPPHRTVRLVGPPIARACAPRASDDWIRVNETSEGFDVSVDTANLGTRRGTLDLKGPTGEAAITIDVELVRPVPSEEQARREAQQAAQGRVTAPETAPRDLPPANPKPARRWSPRRTWLAALGGVAALGLAALLIVMNVSRPPPESHGSWRVAGPTATLPVATNLLRFGPDGHTLIAVYRDNRKYVIAPIFDVATRSQVGTLTSPGESHATNAGISLDGRTLLFTEAGGKYYIWDIAARRQVGSLQTSHRALTFSDQGTLAISDTSSMSDVTELWNARTGARLMSLTEPDHVGVRAAAFSPDGKILAAFDTQGRIRLWDTTVRAVTGTLTLPADVTKLESVWCIFSADGTTLACRTFTGPDQSPYSYLWNVASRRLIVAGPYAARAVSPDGALLAVSDQPAGGDMKLLDTGTGKAIATLSPPHSEGAGAAAFSRDGKSVAVSDHNGSTYMWQLSR